MTRGQLTMSALAVLVAALTLASVAYITIVRPPYLKATRYGVPYYTPEVINPVTNQPVDVNRLVQRYLGE
ncbi:hypothetical protein [Acidihalobacter prosperus]